MCSSDLAHGSLSRQMLATAKADFELKRTVIPENHGSGQWAIRHRNLWQHMLDQRSLSLAKLMPRAPSVKATNSNCYRITHAGLTAGLAEIFAAMVDVSTAIPAHDGETKPLPADRNIGPVAGAAALIEHFGDAL